ncbi:biotin transporter BioY [Halalkalibacterium halodurans]|jgi:biotin transport system substrate-specific component|uniref:Biotin transporter n=2 Tax=Halalkalibacterium halodurans TaxID=86665 RepID=Q9K7K3_HALH5|nr:biotin transporter BioY [Halalkalibacterium halodurans]MDY7223890.1 biotin transporter BioY [Halalkalibacterium halodurans]MDY7243111.1 biotin transporter BioY [Halalkalibacterium halodurans]MED4124733.1 biotin transporter BioY [Halalkalibacterium halodurans]MED4162281.1 biotin transporter BioY [Halalkalibacterium halodurans]MED4172746.1 biotin transporter BioY [Halalkalibacterium halodurans]
MATKSFRTIDLVLVPMFAALMGIGANVTSFLVIGGVPITLQTLFSILAGALLGSRLGAFAMSLYLLVGLVGFPVFAQFKGGLSTFVSPTFGFLISFILVAYVTGKIIEKSESKSFFTFVIACFIGLIINYVVGTNYMYFAYITIAEAPEGFTYSMAWAWMIAPFIKDVIVTIAAAVVAHRIYGTVRKHRPNHLQQAS